MKIERVIIWGHELHDHTHSYIHNAFFIGFKKLNYETHWLQDNIENRTKVDINNSLIIAHGLKTNYLPISDTCIYILHNTELKIINSDNEKIPKKYYCETEKGIPEENIVTLQVYTNDCIDRDKPHGILLYHYYMDPPDKTLYMPWATDLLPEQIDENINNLESIIKKTDVNKLNINFVGMITDKWGKVREYCNKNNINFNNSGGTFNIKHKSNKTIEENVKLIQESIVAPAIQTDWQVNQGYIPCRIFKNISYGKMGVTNNPIVNKLFNDKLIYNENIETLLEKSIDYEKNTNLPEKIEKIKELMIEVRDKHTYINRCNYILEYIGKYYNINE